MNFNEIFDKFGGLHNVINTIKIGYVNEIKLNEECV